MNKADCTLYKVSRVNGDSYEEKAQLNKCDLSARLNSV